MDWQEDYYESEVGWGYEEEEEEDYGHGYGDGAEWPSSDFADQPRCWNGPRCKFLALGTCQYFHPPEDLQWSAQAAPVSASESLTSSAGANVSTAPRAQDDGRKKWNQLVNKTAAGGSAQDESMKRDEAKRAFHFRSDRGDASGGNSSSTSRSRSPPRSEEQRPHRDGRLVATPSHYPSGAGRVQLTPVSGSGGPHPVFPPGVHIHDASGEILAPPPGVW
mmetsp:Transcript_13430/g.31580  ORF Transcript_13430/g.31580 Transcript_13430/m.31580 type:complete len:220 (+) Transcript_13430:137-796(+)